MTSVEQKTNLEARPGNCLATLLWIYNSEMIDGQFSVINTSFRMDN